MSKYLSLSPIHLLTKSLDDTLKNVLFASVATALARKLLPVPGGPYIRIPRHGVRLPVKSCGCLIGRITASFKASLGFSRPATSSQLTFGVSDMIAPRNEELTWTGINSVTVPCITYLLSLAVTFLYQNHPLRLLFFLSIRKFKTVKTSFYRD